MTITKNDLAQVIMVNSYMKKSDATKFIKDFFELINTTLSQGESIKIPGFGSFYLHKKSKRIGRNPKTGEEFPIVARNVISFRPSNILKLAVKEHYCVGIKN